MTSNAADQEVLIHYNKTRSIIQVGDDDVMVIFGINSLAIFRERHIIERNKKKKYITVVRKFSGA